MHICGKCGFRIDPNGPPADRRFLVRVIDELGAADMCGVCAVLLVTDLGRSGDVAVLVNRPAVAS